MLNKVNNNILMGYFGSDGVYHCTMQTVEDADATAANIAACEAGWQTEINTCATQISLYSALKDEIVEKSIESNIVQGELLSDLQSLDLANISVTGDNM